LYEKAFRRVTECDADDKDCTPSQRMVRVVQAWQQRGQWHLRVPRR
jgi:hypothetical protein